MLRSKDLQSLSTTGENKSEDLSRIKMADKHHSCTICLESFPKASILARHLLSHSGEKLHKCAQCDKSFGRGGSLKIHLLIHTGEKPHKCAQCNKVGSVSEGTDFGQKKNLNQRVYWFMV